MIETNFQKLDRIRDYLLMEKESHKRSGNDSEVEELHDLLVDLETIMDEIK